MHTQSSQDAAKQEEERLKGTVALDVFAQYIKAGEGRIMLPLFLFLIVLDRVGAIIHNKTIFRPQHNGNKIQPLHVYQSSFYGCAHIVSGHIHPY